MPCTADTGPHYGLPKLKAMKPTTVHIRKTRHKDQPYTVEIKPPGKAEPYKLKQRYARPFTAKRGAVRQLGGYIHRHYNVVTGRYVCISYKMQNGSPIVFK
jgi:hypothetical protein